MMTWWQNLFNIKKEEPEVDPLVEQLEEKGFRYDEENSQWERVWMVATKKGCERAREVYKFYEEEKRWWVMMYGNNDEIFYEHIVTNTQWTVTKMKDMDTNAGYSDLHERKKVIANDPEGWKLTQKITEQRRQENEEFDDDCPECTPDPSEI